MNYGFCHLSVIPCRAEPSDRSEMVTQLLFGETFKILERNKLWVKIQITDDNYECWIDFKQFIPISTKTFNKMMAGREAYMLDLIQLAIVASKNEVTSILMGSSLRGITDNHFEVEGIDYEIDGNFVFPKANTNRKQVIETASLYQNTPYLWGGRSIFGIDCSGFTQMVYKLNGIKLPRDSWQQAQMGESLSFLEEAKRGDLAFFDNEEGKIVHVGIVMGDGKIIHASGKVRIDLLDHYGIFNTELQKYTHNLRVLKRIIAD